MKKIAIYIASIFSILLIRCSSGEEEAKETENNQVTVETTKTEKLAYKPEIDFAGTLKPWREANLGATLPGKVEHIYYEKGDYVQKGSLIAKLSGEMLAQAKAEYNTIKKDFERVSRLREKESVSQQKYDHLKGKLEGAKAKKEMMEQNTEIRAPFSGTVVSFQVQEGENFFIAPKLKPGYSKTSGIVSLMKLNTLKVEIEINEKDLSRVDEGNTAKIVCDAYPDTTFEGTLHNIAPTLSTTSHTAQAEISLDNDSGILKPGMYADVTLNLNKTKDVFVPLDAIYRLPGTGEDFVFIVRSDSTVKRVKIKRLYNRDGMVAVSGVKDGQTIVITGENQLSDGDKVDIQNN